MIFVLVMMFVPDGLGGLSPRTRAGCGRRRGQALDRAAYLLWLVVGLLLAVGVVFVVESVHVRALGLPTRSLRRANGGALVPLFG